MLINATIKENVLLGKPNATDDEIIKALEKGRAWEFVSKLADGINT